MRGNAEKRPHPARGRRSDYPSAHWLGHFLRGKRACLPLRSEAETQAKPRKKSVDPQERTKVEGYLRTKFNAPNLEVRVRPRKTDSAEIYLGGEFLGVLSKDDEDGELCYHFAMTILELDLQEGAGED
jgi:hypothetical protein